MFGWIKKKQRFEHVKLVKQNLLATEYLGHYYRVAVEGLQDKEAEGILISLRQNYLATKQNLDGLKTIELLPPTAFTDQLELWKELHRIYDDVLAGRRYFAQNFGSTSDRLEPFDRKFVPNEGWKIFVDHFNRQSQVGNPI